MNALPGNPAEPDCKCNEIHVYRPHSKTVPGLHECLQTCIPSLFQNMRNAIDILKQISQGETEIRKGKTKTKADMFKDLERWLKEDSG